MNLIERIASEMQGDDENLDKQSEKLAELYRHARGLEREALDDAFIALCGWSLDTLIGWDDDKERVK